jgi:hypothetical protein
VGGLCIAQLGGSDGGGIVAYDLATGNEKWKWTGNSPAYGSPVLAALGGKKVIIAPTDDNMVALDTADGKLLWETEYSQGRYNAATPIVDGDTLIFAGPERGMTAETLVLEDGKLTVKDLWRNTDHSVQFNTPVLKDGLLFGLSNRDAVFCVDAKSGATLWPEPPSGESGESSGERGRGRGGRGSRGGRGGGGGGYGSVVDAGAVLFTLTRTGKLQVLAPSKEKLEPIASYQVADGGTYAYPVIAGSRIFIKDASSVTLWTVE